MKKTIIIALLLTYLLGTAQQKNTLLSTEFWKTKPDVTSVQSEIAKGNNPSEFNANAFDPVTLAINNDAPNSTIKFLLDQQGNGVNKITHDARTYLHWAAYRGNAELVEYLIKKGFDIKLEDSHGNAPLPFAAMNGIPNQQVFEAFFKAGIDVNQKYINGANILLLTVANDKTLSTTDYLISKGISAKETDVNGATLFDYAARTGNIQNLNALVSRGIKPTGYALLFAAQGARRSSNTIDVYKYLIDTQKLKPSFANKEGENVLHYLVRKPGQTEIISYFIEKGTDVNKIDKDGNTPFIIAGSTKETSVISLLLPKVKKINMANAKGETVLTNAVRNGNTDTVELLVNKGANVNIIDKEGNNLAYYLIQSYKPQNEGERSTPDTKEKDVFTAKMRILQDKGFNFTAVQKDGSTLYHLAATKNDVSLYEKLAMFAQNIDAKNNAGLTPLHKAALLAKDDSVLKFLLSKGANKGIKTEFEETAYDLAKENEYLTKNKISIDFLK